MGFRKGHPINPEAARLANHYVPLILSQLRGSINAENQKKEAAPKNFSETEKDWELSEEDLRALIELPL